MTPFRAKRNSKAPERFSSDETKVDTPNSQSNSDPGEQSKSATKSLHPVREPLKVKLPRPKRLQPVVQPKIKVKISRVNGTNRNLKVDSPQTKASSETSVKSINPAKKQNGSRSLLKKVEKPAGLKKSESKKDNDLMSRLLLKLGAAETFIPKKDSNLQSDGEQKVQPAQDYDKLQKDDLEPSLSKDSESAMQTVMDRRNDQCNTGIRCPCGVYDDIGLMVECEKCSMWQHGHCINVAAEEDAYEGYQCGYCSFPPGQHIDSLKQLRVGDPYKSKFDLLAARQSETIKNPGLAPDNGTVIFSDDELQQAIVDVLRVLGSFKVKCRMLNSEDYPSELKIWHHPIWSENPDYHLTEQQKQSVTFIGDVFKHNLRLHLNDLLERLRSRTGLLRCQLEELRPTLAADRLPNMFGALLTVEKIVDQCEQMLKKEHDTQDQLEPRTAPDAT